MSSAIDLYGPEVELIAATRVCRYGAAVPCVGAARPRWLERCARTLPPTTRERELSVELPPLPCTLHARNTSSGAGRRG
jgi:hypothetical protein